MHQLRHLVSVCPVQAIYEDVDVPAAEQAFVATNAEFFGDEVTGWVRRAA